MNISTGDRLGRFVVSAVLGRGGMGEVWLAEDSSLDRDVALKILPVDFADDADRHSRFEREAKVLASLNHPNIATLYGLEHLEGQHALVMELVEGHGLDEVITQGARRSRFRKQSVKSTQRSPSQVSNPPIPARAALAESMRPLYGLHP